MRPWDGVSDDPRAYASFPLVPFSGRVDHGALPVRRPRATTLAAELPARAARHPRRRLDLALAGRDRQRHQRRAGAGPRPAGRRAALPGNPDLLALSRPARDRDEPHQSRPRADAVRARPSSLFRRPRPGAALGRGRRRLAARRPQRAAVSWSRCRSLLGLPPAPAGATSWCSTTCSRAGAARRWSNGPRPAGRSRSPPTSSTAISSSTSRPASPSSASSRSA